MNRGKFNKRTFNTVRFIYRVGVIKAFLIGLSILFSGGEYEIKWKDVRLKIRKHSSDFYVFRQIFVFGQYDIKDFGKLRPEVIVDLGANAGYSAAYFKMKYPRARVIAVEPEKGNFDQLVKNTRFWDDVECIHGAIWNRHVPLGLIDTGNGDYGFKVSEVGKDSLLPGVSSLTLGDIVEQFQLSKIDILKIDIEGAEKELFESDFEDWLALTSGIAIELHDWFRPGCAASFFRALSAYDYDFSTKGEITAIVLKSKYKSQISDLSELTEQPSHV